MNFVNGQVSWMETHFEVVAAITEALKMDDNKAIQRSEDQGTGGLYELAEELTDAFENKNKGRVWDGEFFEEIESFLDQEL